MLTNANDNIPSQNFSVNTKIEQTILNFVKRKTGEKVRLDFSKEQIVKIVPRTKHGSLALGILWIKVLQHQRNYPVKKYLYKKQVDSNSIYDITLTLSDVTINVDLKTGLLKIKGRFVIEWFVKYFEEILDIYDGLIIEPKIPKAELYTKEEIEQLDEIIEKKKNYYSDNWPSLALRKEVKVHTYKAGDFTAKSDEAQVVEDTQLELMNEEEVDQFTTSLKIGSIINGSQLHRLWKSLLNLWSSKESCTIYIITPRIDTPTLIEICQFSIKYRQTVKIGSICIPMHFDGISLAQIKREALKSFTAQDQMFIEYQIFTQFLYPIQNFEAKVIASVNEDSITNVLSTTGDFNKSGFSSYNKNMALYTAVCEEEFKRKYLNPVMDY